VQYFFDNNISYRLALMLRALDVDAVPLRELFPQDIDDRPLFHQLAGHQYVFVANDKKQLTRQWEATELKKAKLTAIYFGPFWSKMTLWQQAAWLVAKWPQIDGFVRGVERGTIAEIKRNGKASLYQT
jgi:hypothetical protein